VTAELRAFAHPLRLRLYELFAEKPRTTMQVAALLGEPPTRLYHHVNVLQKAGLLRLGETRPIRGAVEKYFEVVRPSGVTPGAKVLESDPAARQSARAAAHAVIEQARHDVLGGMTDFRAPGGAGPVLLRMLISTTPSKAARIQRRILAFVKNVREECGDPPAKDRGRWSLTIAFAPAPRAVPPESKD
jgi:DNA-binding transcriptional ArsR family regulator